MRQTLPLNKFLNTESKSSNTMLLQQGRFHIKFEVRSLLVLMELLQKEAAWSTSISVIEIKNVVCSRHTRTCTHAHTERKNTVSTLTGFPSSANTSAIVPDWSACHQAMKGNQKIRGFIEIGSEGEPLYYSRKVWVQQALRGSCFLPDVNKIFHITHFGCFLHFIHLLTPTIHILHAFPCSPLPHSLLIS